MKINWNNCFIPGMIVMLLGMNVGTPKPGLAWVLPTIFTICLIGFAVYNVGTIIKRRKKP